MARHNVGPKNGFWKGGRTIASNGYVLIRVGRSHHLADVRGYAYKHRLVAEQVLGRRLQPGEQVHHKNEIKTDNRPENLEVASSIAVHRVMHRTTGVGRRLPGQANAKRACACGCGQQFDSFDSSGRPRRFVTGHNTGVRNG